MDKTRTTMVGKKLTWNEMTKVGRARKNISPFVGLVKPMSVGQKNKRRRLEEIACLSAEFVRLNGLVGFDLNSALRLQARRAEVYDLIIEKKAKSGLYSK